jgi:hypothetical protein
MKKLNIIVVLISCLIVAGSILGYGYMNYISDKEKLSADKLKQDNLDNCLKAAKDEYNRVFILNSVEGTTPGGEKARKWNDADAHVRYETQFNSDRDFCLRQFK